MYWILELRNRHLFIIDSLTLAIIPALALTLFIGGFGWWPERSRALFSYTLIAYIVKMSIFYMFGLYNRYWRYANVNEVLWIFATVSLATLIIWILNLSLQMIFEGHVLGLPRSIPLLDGVLTFLAFGNKKNDRNSLQRVKKTVTMT